MKVKFWWFTLVELIVVITIVAILSTIGFVSYGSYISSSRDASRTSQVQIISNSLVAYGAKKSLPLPQNYIQILWGNATSGTGIISYQWTLSPDVLEIVEYKNGWKDPQNGEYFPYVVSAKKNKFQVIAYLEDSENTQEVYTSGNSIGVISQEDMPSTDITLSNITTPLHMIFSNDRGITGTGWQLERAINYALVDRDEYTEAENRDEIFIICNGNSNKKIQGIKYGNNGNYFYTVVKDVSAWQDLFSRYMVSYNRWPLSGRAVIRCDSSMNWYEVIWEDWGKAIYHQTPQSV